ncbi:hypothetical protein PRIPAC_97103 [Pristionchus pacificus]|uniref:Uncharacterized protein n=1 Tax=Pristionchus pacificus TaxID=54126 RepID=A0A2A6D1V0_PRIPA|nr:hypothetical protein PRIPAC_97103 [Pristionchus pacificus]|eukprot:PDM84369.1 hypothetical protein PRIPAC_33392 [Pristionchus pacificus]
MHFLLIWYSFCIEMRILLLNKIAKFFVLYIFTQLVYSLISTGMMLIYLIVTTVTIINTCYPSVLTISDAIRLVGHHEVEKLEKI